jgi:hypothetical protein
MTYPAPHAVTETPDIEPEEQLEEEAPARRQPGILVELHVEGEPEPLHVRVTNRDRIALEKAAARHREWPAAKDAPNFAMTFVSWSAARRAGLTALTFEQWQEALEDYDVIGEEPADPTR